MKTLAIRVENLGKQYRIGTENNFEYYLIRDVITDACKTPFRLAKKFLQKNTGTSHNKESLLWALKNISFEVKHGEVLGIIGRNGAGKSTLLKILSRITEPTIGRAEIYGRVGSLLDVGTGFHPELTGRENIYLNGAILGMKKGEIDKKFDEIVAFSEIEQFLDTPVKHYSSGMYVRLAFAVAAHLEPEILIVDEVLAVGDSAFQNKCLGKIGDITREGRTILFVSHNTVAVQSLCNRVFWLDAGQIIAKGDPGYVISKYLQTSLSSLTSRQWNNISTAPGNDQIRLTSASVQPIKGSVNDPISVSTPFTIEFRYWNQRPNAYININIQLYNEQGIIVFEAGPVQKPIWQPLARGLFHDTCYIPGNLLNDGMYRVVLIAVKKGEGEIYRDEEILIFNIQDSIEFREGWFDKWIGTVRPILEWDRKLLKAGVFKNDVST